MSNLNIHTLSPSFFLKYPEKDFPEIERKISRPYSCLVFNLFQNIYVCVPFRSHISHNNAFIFKKSKRSKSTRSGLDYSKLVIINDFSDISETPGIVDRDEYNEASKNYTNILNEVENYILTYIKHVTLEKTLHNREYMRRYQFSTLPYFKNILLSKYSIS